MNAHYQRSNEAYGVPSTIKISPLMRTDLKQPVSAQNSRNTQNQYTSAQCVFYPNETKLEYTALKRTSTGPVPHKRSRSVNKTREPNTYSSNRKGRGSIERYTGFDGNASLVNESEDMKMEKPEHSRSRESVGAHQTWYGPWTRTSLPGKNAKNIANASSVKGKDIICQRDSLNSQFASEGTKQVDSKGNVLLYFGNPGQSQSNTRRGSPSPFGSAKLIETTPVHGEKPLKEVNSENKSPLLTQTGSYYARSKVQKCQSYRYGPRGNLNSSTEMRPPSVESTPWRSNKITAETLLRTNEKNEPKTPGVSTTQNVFAKIISPNVPSKGATLKTAGGPLVRKNPLNMSSKGLVDNRQMVENYRIDKIIGQGSYAVVRLAVHKENSEKVAIKSYDKFKLNDQHKRNNVKREISILKGLDHPNIVKLYKTVETVTQTHLIMEFPSTQSLHAYVKQKPNRRLPEEEARKIFKQIIEGLRYIHRKNLCHRDIKLENLLLDTDLNVKIIDFGFSIENPKDKTLNVFCGTPSYMAPELAAKKDYYGHLADIWAAGILLYVLLAGYFPFRDPNEKELFRKISRGQYDFSSQISEDARNLIKKMLRMNPIERLSADEILQDKWITGQQGHSTNLKNYLDTKIQQYKSIQAVSLTQPEVNPLRA